MVEALLWMVVVVGPDFITEARWATLRFPEREQCENWLGTAVKAQHVVKLPPQVRLECAPTDTVPNEIEE